jgi:hypothetical protein
MGERAAIVWLLGIALQCLRTHNQRPQVCIDDRSIPHASDVSQPVVASLLPAWCPVKQRQPWRFSSA